MCCLFMTKIIIIVVLKLLLLLPPPECMLYLRLVGCSVESLIAFNQKVGNGNFFNKLYTKIFMYILCIILHIYFTFFSFENKKQQQQRNVSNEITENIAFKLFLYCYLYLISTERHYSHF